MTEHSTNLRALTDGSEWDKPSNGTCEKLTAAAAHIDAQDAKIKALVEALGRLSFELGALEAFEAQVRREIGNTNYTAIMTRLESARALSQGGE